MLVKEILTGSFVLILIATLIWNNRRFIYLARKLPMISITTSLSSIFGGLQQFFEILYQELKGKRFIASLLGPILVIHVMSPEDLKIVFNSKVCVDKPYFGSKFVRGFSKGSLFGTLDTWQSHRRILNPFFSPQSLRSSVIPIFNRKVSILVSNIEKMKGKGEFNVFHHMTALTLETILSVMNFERDIQNQETKSRDAFITNLEK
jgi:cytochrome P450